MKRSLSTLVGLAVASVLLDAQVSRAVVLTTPSYSENFDEPRLSNTAVDNHWLGSAQNAVPGSSGWVGVRLGGTGTELDYEVNNGGSNEGAIYSYGATGSTERALGSVASGTNFPGFGLELQNGLSGAITQVTIDYIGEFWRSSTSAQNVLTFGYLVGPAGSTSFLTDAATSVAALDLVGPAPVGANGALDGNVEPNRDPFSATFSVNVPVGQSLYVRWQDFNDLGNDAGLAVDNFQITATVVPEPAGAVLALFGAAAAVIRRRNARRCIV